MADPGVAGGGQLRLFDAAGTPSGGRSPSGRGGGPGDGGLRLPVERPVVVDLDVTVDGGPMARVRVGGPTPEEAVRWLRGLVGVVEVSSRRNVAIRARDLDRLVCVPAPWRVTLDAAARTVGLALWAEALGWGRLRVERVGQRLVARSPRSPRWPEPVRDGPWTAVRTLEAIGVPWEVAPGAARLVAARMRRPLVRASLAGPSVLLESTHPEIVTNLGVSPLLVDGPGRWLVPLTAARGLLGNHLVAMGPRVRAAVREATGRARPLRVPRGFPWRLYDFQRTDAAEAARILRAMGGVLLAGTMGTGKTTVALALLESLGLWPALIVAPVAALSTWGRQLDQLGRRWVTVTGSVSEHLADRPDALVVTYDRFWRLVPEVPAFAPVCLVADEIQRIRSPGSRRSRALRQVAAVVPVRIGLSGTPLQNHLRDLFAPGAFLVPSQWPARAGRRELAARYGTDDIEDAVADHLGCLMVRRTFESAGIRIPGARDHRLWVEPTDAQREALRRLEEQARADRDSGRFSDPRAGRIHIFAALSRMRRVVSCPAAEGVGGRSPKVEATVDLVRRHLLGGGDGKVVVFCAHRSSWTAVTAALDRAGIGWVGINGSTPLEGRLDAERRFHDDPRVGVFVGTIQSCSEALTLSPTGKLLIYTDLVYDLGAMSQSRARIVRLNMDRDRPVDIVRILCRGTVDERIEQILADKEELFARVVDRSRVRGTRLDHSDTEALIWALTGER